MSDYHETQVDDWPGPEPVEPLWKREPLRNRKGEIQQCMHYGCGRNAVRIVSYESPKHREFKGQTHNCCSVHSKPSTRQETS